MRKNIVHEGAGELTYQIREITDLAHQVQALGQPIIWENIGDPVAAGASVPDWIKQIVSEAAKEDGSYGYSPTKGLERTREFLAKERSQNQKREISSEDILFFNGLGDAVSKVYNYLARDARVIGPSPAYPTHSSAEGAHAGSSHLTYRLNPDRNWLPDMEDLSNKVKYNPNIAGILIINPDNPTGMVYPRVILEQIVSLAREHGLFLISDEIYASLAYGQEGFCSLAEVARDVPAIAMRGLSKEIPWPGSRCGWIEVYNQHQDPNFSRYFKSIEAAKRLEVCSTTLPQAVLPDILGDERYKKHLAERRAFYHKRAQWAHKILARARGVRVVRPAGAFYISVIFDPEALGDGNLAIENDEVRECIERAASGRRADHRFVYSLLGSTGICVVPMSGFNSDLPGFRATLLEEDDERFEHTFQEITRAINQLTSG